MEKKRLLIYLAVLLIGLIISFYTIRTHFDVKTIVILLFFLIFLPTLLNPDIGLIIIIISMLLSPEVILGKTLHREITVRIEDIFLLIIILAWLIRTAFTKDIGKTFKTYLTAPFFSYIGICILSTVLAVIFTEYIDVGHSFFSILKYLEYFLLFLMVKDNIRSLKQSEIFVAVFLLIALIVSIHSNVFIEKHIAGGEEFFRTAPPVETRGGGESGTLGGYLVFMMAIAGGLLLYSPSLPARVFLIILEVLMFRGLLYSLSRGSYLAIIPMIITLVHFTKRRKHLLMFILVSLTLLMIVFMPEMVKERILTTVTFEKRPEGLHLEWEESPQSRLESWKMVLFDLWPSSPIFGHGVGKFFIDSQFFSTLAAVGLAGLILFLWVLVILFKMTRDVLNVDLVKGDNFSQGLAVGFLAGYIGLCVHAISTNTFIIIGIMEPFWFMAAIVLSLPQLLMQEKGTLEEVSKIEEVAEE